MIAVQGPTSQATLQGLTERDLGELEYFRFWPEQTTVAGVAGLGAAHGLQRGEGLRGRRWRPATRSTVWDALIEAGGTPFGLTAIDLARTEVGLIIIAVDYNPGELSPWDLSMDRFIKTDTECVGAEALADRGREPAEAVQDAPDRGRRACPSTAPRSRRTAAQVGVVTSPAASPAPRHDRPGDPRRRRRERRREGRGRRRGRHRARDGRGAVAARPEQGAPARLSPRRAGRRPPLCWAHAGDDALFGVVPNFSEGRRTDVIDAIVRGARTCRAHGSSTPRPTPTTTGSTPRCSAAPTRSGRARMAGAARRRRTDRHAAAHGRASADGRRRRDPVHAGARRHDRASASSSRAAFGRDLAERARPARVPLRPRGAAARAASLADVRRGEFEGLREAVARGERLPDFGPHAIGPAGATAVGARKPLVAFNVYLDGTDEDAAKAIAQALRESVAAGCRPCGRSASRSRSGRLVTVSMNLVDHEVTGLRAAFDAVARSWRPGTACDVQRLARSWGSCRRRRSAEGDVAGACGCAGSTPTDRSWNGSWTTTMRSAHDERRTVRRHDGRRVPRRDGAPSDADPGRRSVGARSPARPGPR